MIHKRLKKFLDTLTEDSCPIVIDCGHVDTEELTPRIADGFTLQEGLECFRLLKAKGFKEVFLSILFNDTHIFGMVDSMREGRKKIRKLRSEVKSQGIPNILFDVYKETFKYHKIPKTNNFFTSDFIYLSENSLILQSRQQITKYREEENPFHATLISSGDRGLYCELPNKEKWDVAYERNGAPGWPLVSANITKFFEDKEFKTIICLRDIHWKPRVLTGGKMAQKLYRTEIETYSFFYDLEKDIIVESVEN